MPQVKASRIGYTQPLHGLREVSPRCSQEEMVVIVHEHIGIHLNGMPVTHLSQDVNEQASIMIVYNDISLLVAS